MCIYDPITHGIFEIVQGKVFMQFVHWKLQKLTQFNTSPPTYGYVPIVLTQTTWN